MCNSQGIIKPKLNKDNTSRYQHSYVGCFVWFTTTWHNHSRKRWTNFSYCSFATTVW